VFSQNLPDPKETVADRDAIWPSTVRRSVAFCLITQAASGLLISSLNGKLQAALRFATA
jgi:hypothetical protein